MRKLAFAILFTIGCYLVSCNSGPAEVKSDVTDSSAYFKGHLKGEWVICAMSLNGIRTDFNTCPKINFDVDSAVFIGASGWSNKMLWGRSGGLLKLRYEHPHYPEGMLAEDSLYKAVFERKGVIAELRLTQVHKKITYILTRKITM